MANIKTKLTDVYNALTGESKQPHEFKGKADVIAKISENVSGGGGTVDTAMSDSSTNPVQNKVIKNYVDGKFETFVIDATTTLEGSTLTLDITHGELQDYMNNGKVVRMVTTIGTKTFSTAIGYVNTNEDSNVAYFMSMDGQNDTPLLVKSDVGALTDHITITYA